MRVWKFLNEAGNFVGVVLAPSRLEAEKLLLEDMREEKHLWDTGISPEGVLSLCSVQSFSIHEARAIAWAQL